MENLTLPCQAETIVNFYPIIIFHLKANLLFCLQSLSYTLFQLLNNMKACLWQAAHVILPWEIKGEDYITADSEFGSRMSLN